MPSRNIAKGTTDPRVEFILPKYPLKVISQVQTQILITFHLQNLNWASTKNLNQTSASPLNLKFKILTKPSFRISTKIQLHYLYKTSAAKYWPNSSLKICLNFNFKILTKPSFRISTRIQHHNLNQTTAAKYWPNSRFKISPELQLQNFDQGLNKILVLWLNFRFQLPNGRQYVSQHQPQQQ